MVAGLALVLTLILRGQAPGDHADLTAQHSKRASRPPALTCGVKQPGSSRVIPARAGHPGRGGALWLRMIFPAGLVTWLVPSG
jgi:hypothetical protein